MKIPKKLTRTFEIREAKVDPETRELEFSFSSELPVERYFGMEVLSHDEDSADFSRLNNGAPLLFNHDWDKHPGGVMKAWIDKETRLGRCRVKFGRSELAKEKMQDVEDGILTKVSFGYTIDPDSMVLTKKGGDGARPEFTVHKWTPYEVSLVTVPADNTVGIGRSADQSDEEIEVSFKELPAEQTDAPAEVAQEIQTEIENKIEGSEKEQNQNADQPANERTLVMQPVDNAVDAAKMERQRIQTINAIGEKYGQTELARQMVESGSSIDQMRDAVLEKLGARLVKASEQPGYIDMTEKEKRSYSLVRAVRASIDKNWKNAGFEKELSDEIAKRSGRDTQGFFMPMNITLDQRDASAGAYAVGSTNAGSKLVATNLLAGSFIEMLRNRSMVVQMGAQMLSGLVGNVAIPRQTGAVSTYWVTEGVDVTEAEGTFDQMTLSPKTIGARSQMTRNMLLQSTPDIEMLARNDLALQIALGIDLAAISGTGSSGQPRGILNQSGIGSVVGGTNGAAVTIDHLIDLETAVATANADFGSLGYLTNPKVVGALKKLKSTAGDYLWTNNPGGGRSGTPGEINGYVVGRTNQVSSALTKGTASGVCSAVIFGNFSDLVIGEWGALEILANPFGAGFNNGSVDIRALQTVDTGVRHAASFAAMVDALTA